MKDLVVISGKGGTGKTSITAGLACLGPNKILSDADVDAADLHLVLNPKIKKTHEFWGGEQAKIDKDLCSSCGLCREHCRFSAITEDFVVKPEHCEGCGMCEYICPEGAAKMFPNLCGHWYESDTRFGPMIHADLKPGEENSGKLVTTVRNAARDAAEAGGYDFVLTDGSPGIGCPVIASLTGADAVLVVAEPTVSAVHDLKRVTQLTAHFKIKTLVLVNKYDINPAATADIEEFCRTGGFPVIEKLPYIPDFTKAQIKGMTLPEYDDSWTKTFAGMWEILKEHV